MLWPHITLSHFFLYSWILMHSIEHNYSIFNILFLLTHSILQLLSSSSSPSSFLNFIFILILLVVYSQTHEISSFYLFSSNFSLLHSLFCIFWVFLLLNTRFKIISSVKKRLKHWFLILELKSKSEWICRGGESSQGFGVRGKEGKKIQQKGKIRKLDFYRFFQFLVKPDFLSDLIEFLPTRVFKITGTEHFIDFRFDRLDKQFRPSLKTWLSRELPTDMPKCTRPLWSWANAYPSVIA